MINLDFLEKGVEVFNNLDDNQLTSVLGCCQEEEFQKGDTIFAAGDEPGYLCAVIEGEVVLHQEQQEGSNSQIDAISKLTRGMAFGWSSLVPSGKYQLTALCSSRQCKVLKIDKECLLGLFNKDTRMGYVVMSEIVSVVGIRFHQLREEIIKRIGHDIINRW